MKSYNQELSEKRAEAVRGCLISQGVKPDDVSAVGEGKSKPVADNSTASGRKLNRRVEMVVSGEAIGNQTNGPAIELAPTAQNQ